MTYVRWHMFKRKAFLPCYWNGFSCVDADGPENFHLRHALVIFWANIIGHQINQIADPVYNSIVKTVIKVIEFHLILYSFSSIIDHL